MVKDFRSISGCAMLHKNSREKYDKLKRVFRRLMQNFNNDDLDDFIATANSMPEWMRADNSLVQEQKEAIERFTVDESIDWQICNQVANRQKHARVRNHGRPAQGVGQVQINPGGRGVLLQSTHTVIVIGAGQDIYFDYSGTQESALAFVIRTFNHFHYMFEMAPIPPAQRQIPTLEELAGVR